MAYANEAKTDLLGVDPALIEAHGAVSEEVAEAMAAGALDRFGADTAISITGIAGPDGGSEEKPVGTVVWSVRLGDGDTVTRRALLPGDRTRHPRARHDRGDAPAPARSHGRGGRPPLSGPRARMFVALDLPADAREKLAGWRDELVEGRRDLRPVRAEALHVTLVFLGWQDETAAEAIAEATFGARPAAAAPLLVPGEVRASAPARPASVRARPGGRGRPRGCVAGGGIGRARGRALVSPREAPVLAAHHAGARQAR